MIHLPFILLFLTYSVYTAASQETDTFTMTRPWSNRPFGPSESDWSDFVGTMDHTSTSFSTTHGSTSSSVSVQGQAVVTAVSTRVATQTLVLHTTSVSSISSVIETVHATHLATKTLSVPTFRTTSSTSTSSSASVIVPGALATNPAATAASQPTSSPTPLGATLSTDHGLSTVQIVLLVLGVIILLTIAPAILIINRRMRRNGVGFIPNLMVRRHPSRVISPFIANNVQAELDSPAPANMTQHVSPLASSFAYVPEKHRTAFENALALEEQPDHMSRSKSIRSNRSRTRTLNSTTSTARQVLLQNQAEFIRGRIATLQQSSAWNDANELPRLQMNLRDVVEQMDSDWALGLSDDPPPVYNYYQTPPPSAKFASSLRVPSPSLAHLPPTSKLLQL